MTFILNWEILDRTEVRYKRRMLTLLVQGGGPNVPAHLENAIYSKFYLGK